MNLSTRDVSRFWSKVDKSRGATECWIWTDEPDAYGYGVMRVGTKVFKATHISLHLVGKARISSKHGACHTCNNTICVQPLHIYWGTQKQNNGDRNNGIAIEVLTEHQALQVLELLNKGVSRARLARTFKVSWNTIDRIYTGDTWSHLGVVEWWND